MVTVSSSWTLSGQKRNCSLSPPSNNRKNCMLYLEQVDFNIFFYSWYTVFNLEKKAKHYSTQHMYFLYKNIFTCLHTQLFYLFYLYLYLHVCTHRRHRKWLLFQFVLRITGLILCVMRSHPLIWAKHPINNVNKRICLPSYWWKFIWFWFWKNTFHWTLINCFLSQLWQEMQFN